MKFWPTFISNSLLPLVAIIFGFTVVSQFPTETLFWLSDKNWLPYPILATSIILASQFNQSRFFYAAWLWVALLFTLDKPELIPFTNFEVSMLFPLIAIANAVLLWQQDRGLRLYNILLNSLIIGASIGVTLFIMQWEAILNHPVYQSWSNSYFSAFTTLSGYFSLLELCFYCILLCTLMVRLTLKPKLSHTLLAASIVIMFILQFNYDEQLIRFASGLFALIAALIVLLDSHTMAFKDELTGISSRRALTHFTKSLLNNYTVVMADVDHFKAFNDKYGHDVGDQVLRMVAQQLNQVSQGGKTYRYGGEEFTLIFPGKKPEQVFEIVDDLRDSIANYPLVIRQPDRPKQKPTDKTTKPHQPKQQVVHVTMSFGVALKDKNTPYEQALKIADQALYKAKKAGRNKVKLG